MQERKRIEEALKPPPTGRLDGFDLDTLFELGREGRTSPPKWSAR